MEQAWVTVERFRDLSAAIVARSALEAAEIPCYLRDENTVRMDWQISNFIGGMRLDVAQEDLEAARATLDGVALSEDPASDTGAALANERCPHCGRTAIHREAKRRGMSLAALLFLALPLPQGRQVWRCEHCGARWEEHGG